VPAESPQVVFLQALHLSSVVLLPSSHFSPLADGVMMPSPQVGGLQMLVQRSVLMLLPSSQVSTPV
jgi:hypothetical protein